MKEQWFHINEFDKATLLKIARATIQHYLMEGNTPELDPSDFSDTLFAEAGAFVTLHKHGRLRGCIGSFSANQPLYKTIQSMAISAATRDYRFEQVTIDELPELHLEISVLTPMQQIDTINKIQLGVHGIYIKKGLNAGTFLPQVATDTGWSLEEFLGHCSRDKAHLGWNGWKDAEIFIYEAIVFEEGKH